MVQVAEDVEPSADGGTQVTETFDYSRYTGLSKAFIEVLRFPERNRKGIEGTLVRLKERVAALVRRWHKHDSTVGGQLSEAALVTLRVDEDGWSYERRPLWTEDVLGIEMS